MFKDKTLVCRDCGREFVFSASEQEFYEEKGFTNEPGRCPACRQARKQNRNDSGRNEFRGKRAMYTVTCAACGAQTQVPFQPTNNRPVYCSDCFRSLRNR